MNMQLLRDVARTLASYGHDAVIEYPGYIHVQQPDGDWNIGTANGPWGGDKRDGAESFEIDGSEGWTDAQQIAAAVDHAMRTSS